MSGGFVGKPIDGSTQAVAYTGTQGRSTVLGGQTTIVRIVCTSNAHLKFGGSAVAATTGDLYITSGREEYFYVQPASYVSAIQDSAGGTMYLTEMSR